MTPTAFVQGEEARGKRSPPAQVPHPVFGSRCYLDAWRVGSLGGICDPWAGESVRWPLLPGETVIQGQASDF